MQQGKTEIKENDYYKQIVNLANVAIVKFDKDFIITDFTGNAEVIFGFKKQEVVGRSLYDTIVPRTESTGRDLEKLINNIVKNIASYEYNVNENITREGKRIWIQWYNSEIRNKNNELTGVISIGINITDRVNAENALKESEERFKKLSNLTFEGVLIHDNGIILDCNLTFEKQTGYSREELIGMNFFDKLLPKKFHKLILQKMKSGAAQYEAEAKHKNGRVFPVTIESRSTKIGNKRVRVAAIRNISELKRTIVELDAYNNRLEEIVRERTEELNARNDLLKFERNQLRTIIDNIPDLIYIKDKESRILNANLRHVHHLKKNRLDDVIGKTDFDFYENRYAEMYFSDEQMIFRTGRPVINKEELSINEFGKHIYLSTTKVPLKDQKGSIIGIVGIGRDITGKKSAENKLKVQAKKLRDKKVELEATLDQLKKAQSQLIQSEKLASLGILLAGIAHEINNPVNFIYAGVNSIIKDFEDIKVVIDGIDDLEKNSIGNTSLSKKIEELKNEREFDLAYEAINETLQDIKLGATRIKEIIEGLSRFSRLETEDWKLANLHEEIDNVLILLKNKYKHNIEIVKDYDPSLPVLECYPGKLNQVFMNIINNAIDAIEDKRGKITIKTGVSSGMVNVVIKDTGTGIGKEAKPKIFDPFFTTKEAGFGLGLGLAISYSIIQEHNGEITVKSESGKGTEFTVRIPVAQQHKGSNDPAA